MLSRNLIYFLSLLLLLTMVVGQGQLVTNAIGRFNTNSYPTGSLAGEWSNWVHISIALNVNWKALNLCNQQLLPVQNE